jgi:hypothetical protein
MNASYTMIVLLLLVPITPRQCRPAGSTDENTLQHEKAASMIMSGGETTPQAASQPTPQAASQNAIRELIAPKPTALASSSARAVPFQDLEKAEDQTSPVREQMSGAPDESGGPGLSAARDEPPEPRHRDFWL